ncbi:MAG: hypothetical protein WD097_06325 [Balneolales bacterium]
MPHKNESGITAVIPLPIQVVIDDVGWWSGEDGNQRQEPYRTGIDRNHVPADYSAIVRLGQQLGIRPQAAMILCEWDKENILRQLPTSTWMGADWDNKKWVGPWLEEAAEIIRNNRDHYELTMHGVGHEYWIDGQFTRAEWADSNGTMRPLDQVELHLDYFGALLRQHGLEPFPTSFVPTAFLHGFGPTGDHDQSMAAVLAKRGFEYINTPFYNMYNAGGTQYEEFGFDAGVITVDRGRDIFSWRAIGQGPDGEVHGATCGLHWPNLLHLDPERNFEVVDQWVEFLRPYNDRMDTMLAPNSLAFRHQLVHHVCTKTEVTGAMIMLDFNEVDMLPGNLGRSNLTLKLQSPVEMAFESSTIRLVDSRVMEHGTSYHYTLQLERMPGIKEARISLLTTER